MGRNYMGKMCEMKATLQWVECQGDIKSMVTHEGWGL